MKFCKFAKNVANFWQKKFSDNHGQNILAKSHKLSNFSKACFLIPPYAKFSPWNDKISMKINVLDLYERFSFSFSSFYLIFWPNYAIVSAPNSKIHLLKSSSQVTDRPRHWGLVFHLIYLLLLFYPIWLVIYLCCDRKWCHTHTITCKWRHIQKNSL